MKKQRRKTSKPTQVKHESARLLDEPSISTFGGNSKSTLDNDTTSDGSVKSQEEMLTLQEVFDNVN